jgi:hypothetical protein
VPGQTGAGTPIHPVERTDAMGKEFASTGDLSNKTISFTEIGDGSPGLRFAETPLCR